MWNPGHPAGGGRAPHQPSPRPHPPPPFPLCLAHHRLFLGFKLYKSLNSPLTPASGEELATEKIKISFRRFYIEYHPTTGVSAGGLQPISGASAGGLQPISVASLRDLQPTNGASAGGLHPVSGKPSRNTKPISGTPRSIILDCHHLETFCHNDIKHTKHTVFEIKKRCNILSRKPLMTVPHLPEPRCHVSSDPTLPSPARSVHSFMSRLGPVTSRASGCKSTLPRMMVPVRRTRS